MVILRALSLPFIRLIGSHSYEPTYSARRHNSLRVVFVQECVMNFGQRETSEKNRGSTVALNSSLLTQSECADRPSTVAYTTFSFHSSAK